MRSRHAARPAGRHDRGEIRDDEQGERHAREQQQRNRRIGERADSIGATNVLRVMGKKWGYFVFGLDALKGFAAVRIAFAIALASNFGIVRPELVGITGGLACILGHTFSVWLRFRGGKGVATSAGVLLGLMPLAVVSVFAVWVILFQFTRYVSVASIGAADCASLLCYALPAPRSADGREFTSLFDTYRRCRRLAASL